MEIAFWCCLFIVFYTYLGYGMLLYILVRIKRALCKRKTHDHDPSFTPDITLMICAYNEEDIVDEKMANTRQIDYPKDKLHVHPYAEP